MTTLHQRLPDVVPHQVDADARMMRRDIWMTAPGSPSLFAQRTVRPLTRKTSRAASTASREGGVTSSRA